MSTVKFELARTATTFIGLQFGNYRIEQLLGKGSYAATYKAKHRYLGTPAAVKIILPRQTNQEVQNFYSEARNLADLMHSNIVHFLEFGIQNNIPFLVMEYAPYGTLRQLHPEEVPLSLNIVLNYVRQIASGMQYLHDRGYIHQDMKPENLLIGRNRRILISDFGNTITLQEAYALNRNKIVGTIPYMAPEHLRGDPCFATDQYALGVIVYEWLCGTLPFNGSSLEIQRKHLYVEPPSMRVQVPTIPTSVEQAVLRALNKDPEQRFSSIRAFAKALELVYQCESVEHPVPLKFRATLFDYPPLASGTPTSSLHFQSQMSNISSPWYKIMILFASYLLIGSIGGALFHTFRIEAPTIRILLILYFIFFAFVGALVLRSRQAFF